MLDPSHTARDIISRAKQTEPLRYSPEFEVLGPPGGDPLVALLAALLCTRACTSLSDAEATERINLIPPMGDHGRWVLCTTPGQAPVPCEDKPATHRHLMWEC